MLPWLTKKKNFYLGEYKMVPLSMFLYTPVKTDCVCGHKAVVIVGEKLVKNWDNVMLTILTALSL